MSLTLSLTPEAHVYYEHSYDGSSLSLEASQSSEYQRDRTLTIRSTTSQFLGQESEPESVSSLPEFPNKHSNGGCSSVEHQRRSNVFCIEHQPATTSNDSFQTVSLNHILQDETFNDNQEDNAQGTGDGTYGKEPKQILKPFRRWLSMIQKNSQPEELTKLPFRWLIDDVPCPHEPCNQTLDTTKLSTSYHRKSKSNNSSNGFVTAIRSATMTVAGSSITGRTWSGLSSRFVQVRQSVFHRPERESHGTETPSVDDVAEELASERAIRRWKILEELVDTEESYVVDLRLLMNVYFTLLASACTISTAARASIRDNIQEILHLHENLLDELRAIVPRSEMSQSFMKDTPYGSRKGHVRWHSADMVSKRTNHYSRNLRKLRHSIDSARPSKAVNAPSTAGPATVRKVIKAIDRYNEIHCFLAYENYGAHYEMMIHDLASTSKAVSAGQAFEKGIEVLARTIEPINTHFEHNNKGLTIADLIIKPIQRICKYPLLFDDLRKQTPSADDPVAHSEIEKLLSRLKDITLEMNKATGDTQTRDLIRKTWMLQDRLVFQDKTICPPKTRLLGHMVLCGVLFATYQTNNSIDGQYMLCVLFQSYLLLATPAKNFDRFDVVAILSTTRITIEQTDNGKGLQCHTCPFAWKLVFEFEHKLFEILLCACSKKEEEIWKRHLCTYSTLGDQNLCNLSEHWNDSCSTLILDMKPIGILYGPPTSLATRVSIHRAATVGQRSQMSQIIIKNTSSVDEAYHLTSSSLPRLARSQSMMSAGLVPVFTPRRSERIQLEMALSDIWTKSILPFPGMKQSENPFRASANHVMRKLSMASIASSFSRRPSSHIGQRKSESSRPPTPFDLHPSDQNDHLDRSLPRPAPNRLKKTRQSSRPHIIHRGTGSVDFHKSPERFLPRDFELPGKYARTGRLQKPKSISALAVENESISCSRLSNPPGSLTQKENFMSRGTEPHAIDQNISRTPNTDVDKSIGSKDNEKDGKKYRDGHLKSIGKGGKLGGRHWRRLFGQ